MKFTKMERDMAIENLRNYLKPEQCVYTKLNYVSRSGMKRVIDLYVVSGNEIVRITWNAAAAINGNYDIKREGLTMNGCGMDMGFAAVYDLSHAVFGNGYAINHRWL